MDKMKFLTLTLLAIFCTEAHAQGKLFIGSDDYLTFTNTDSSYVLKYKPTKTEVFHRKAYEGGTEIVAKWEAEGRLGMAWAVACSSKVIPIFSFNDVRNLAKVKEAVSGSVFVYAVAFSTLAIECHVFTRNDSVFVEIKHEDGIEFRCSVVMTPFIESEGQNNGHP